MTDANSGLELGYTYKYKYKYKVELEFGCSLSLSDDAEIDFEPITVSRELRYDYSDIACQILGGENKKVSEVSVGKLRYLTFSLDGYTFRYDPEFYFNIPNKSHLEFEWSCNNYNNDNLNNVSRNCTDLLKNDNTMVNFGNETFTSNSTSYVFGLTVCDTRNDDRDICTTQQTLTIDNINLDEDEDVVIKLLDIPVSSVTTNSIINEKDELRLLVVINNADEINFKNEKKNYEFEYSQTNGCFEYDELNGDDGSFNLVLESGSLSKGMSYQFEVKAFYIGVTPYVEV